MTKALVILAALTHLFALRATPLTARPPVDKAPAKGNTVKVSIQKMKFTPPTVSLRPGDTVVWTNNDQHDHTVEAADGSFSSGTLSPGDTYSHKVTREGTIKYNCSLHPRMRGALTVK